MTENKERLTVEEIARLIHLRNELKNMVDEWKKHGWGPGLATKFKAMSKVFAGEPAPSARFKNIASRKQALTQEQCQMLINGGMLALTYQAGGKLYIKTMDIYEANAALGTVAIAISDDDSQIMFTGMKEQ